MFGYLLRRLLAAIPVILGVVTVLFLVFELLGDPARLIAGQRTDTATLAAIRQALRLDLPTWQRYLLYLNDLSPVGQLAEEHQPNAWVFAKIGQHPIALKLPWLGRSYQNGRPVLDMYLEQLPGTAVLALLSMAFATVLGITLGSIAAVRQGTWIDRILGFVAQLGISAPSFFVAVVMMGIFAVALGPITGLRPSGYWLEEDVFTDSVNIRWDALVLPVLTLALRPMSVLFQLIRDGMSDVLRTDYIRTAKAMGLPNWLVLLRYALPNALTPFLIAVSGWLAALLTGAFFVEYIFDWQGIGRLTIDALGQSDYPVLMGSCVLTAALFVLVNVLTDLINARLDPRIKLNA